MSNFEKVIFKKVFFENFEITFWDSLKKTQTYVISSTKLYFFLTTCLSFHCLFISVDEGFYFVNLVYLVYPMCLFTLN